jgi:hypothetical protein
MNSQPTHVFVCIGLVYILSLPNQHQKQLDFCVKPKAVSDWLLVKVEMLRSQQPISYDSHVKWPP